MRQYDMIAGKHKVKVVLVEDLRAWLEKKIGVETTQVIIQELLAELEGDGK